MGYEVDVAGGNTVYSPNLTATIQSGECPRIRARGRVGRGASSRVGISSTWSLAGTTTEERERTNDMLAGTSENDRRMPKPSRAQKTWKRKIRAGAPWITVARSAKTGNRFGREEDSNSNSTSVTHVQGFPHNIVSYCSVGKCYITVKHKSRKCAIPWPGSLQFILSGRGGGGGGN